VNQKKSILFVGDSFTWGEGLELYTDTPKWINERQKDNSKWADILKHKQDTEGTEFRNKNRFPALTSKELGSDFFVDDENGGTIARNLFIIEKNIVQNDVTDIVLQFSSLNREPYHLTHECRCEYCIKTACMSLYDGFFSYKMKIDEKKLHLITNEEKYIVDFIKNKLDEDNIESVNFLNKLDLYSQKHFNEQLTLLSKSFFVRLENIYGIKIHFIDSWCKKTSELLHKNVEVKNKFIPLIGKDNKKYFKWADWLNTFENKAIKEEFPKTGNGHPTLEMHQYLAKSIISHFQLI